MNKVLLVGRVGKEPEIKEVGENIVSKFSLATNENFKKNNEWQTTTEWHNVEIWRDVKYLSKGSLIAIEGKIKTDSYEKDGSNNYYTKIVASKIELLSKNKDNQESETEEQSNDDSVPF